MAVDSSLLAFAGLSLLLAMTPGPDMALITRNGLTHGRRGIPMTVAGLAVGVTWWAVAAAVGVASLLAASATAFAVIKLAGAIYLAYLGIRTLLASRRTRPLEPLAKAPVNSRKLFQQGLLSAALNPKLGVFFVTLLPQFLHAGEPPLARMLMLGAIFDVIGIGWMLGYGLLVTRVRDVIGSPRVRAWMERVTGAVLLGFAARLALTRA